MVLGIAAGASQLSALAGGLPVGIAGGAGYGFGIRYGFEQLFPAFQEGGVQGAIHKINSDLEELVSNIINLDGTDDSRRQSRGLTGNREPNVRAVLPPTVTEDPHVQQPVVAPLPRNQQGPPKPVKVPTIPSIKSINPPREPRYDFTIKFRHEGKSSTGTQRYSVTREQLEHILTSKYNYSQRISGPKQLTQLSIIHQLQLQYKELFNEFYPLT